VTENPSAFPLNATNDATPGAFCPDPGMTLRDYFAGQALASVMSTAQNMGESTQAERAEAFGLIASWMYEVADAMLSARQETRHGE